jgi:alpha-tubulin suppressor-like RCC1 family protein
MNINNYFSQLKIKRSFAITLNTCLAILLPSSYVSAANGYALMAMGNNETSQLGMEEMSVSIENIYINPVVTATSVTDISAGGVFSLYSSPEGYMHGMGEAVKSKGAAQNGIASYVIGYDAGYKHAVVIYYDGTPNGTLYTFGDNTYGQLGNGGTGPDTSDKAKAIEAEGKIVVYTIVRNAKSASAGTNHTLYVASTNDLYGMGSGYFGQLGQGDMLSHADPVKIASDVAIADAGANHSLYLTTDGTLYGIGLNADGELGDNSTTNRYKPVKIATGVTAFSAGDTFSMYITSDGKLYGMGSNEYGQLGLGDVTRVIKPTLVASDVTAVSCGGKHSMYITKDGTLYGMGDNFLGQLGDGTCTDQHAPKKIDTSVKAVSAGYDFTLYLKPNVSMFKPIDKLQTKWSDWGWINDESFPWVWSYNYNIWFYVYDGVFAYSSNGYWIAYYNSDSSDYGWGYVYPGSGWWCITSDGAAHWLYFGDPIPKVTKTTT